MLNAATATASVDQTSTTARFGQERDDEPRGLTRCPVGVKDREQDPERQHVEG